MVKYGIVEKDVEEKVGFVHSGYYDTIKEAEKYIKILKRSTGTEYYEYFIAEIED